MKKIDFYLFAKAQIKCQEVAYFYLGEPENSSNDNYYYISPFREKERTASFCVNNIMGMHDFGTDKHYDNITFVSELFRLNKWNATVKLLIDLKISLDDIKNQEIMVTGNKRNKDIPNIKLLTGIKPDNIICYFDEVRFEKKPTDNYSLAQIKNRIKENCFYQYQNINEIAREILRGKTCIPSAIKGNPKINWRQQQMFLIDFDNKIDNKNITIDNSKHVTVEKILEFCEKESIKPTIIYYTFSHSEKQHKFRLVYVLGEPIKNIDIAKQTPYMLMEKLKKFNPDTSKKNLSDMFLGGKGLAYIGENYYKIKEKN